MLEFGRRADFAILDAMGNVTETWVEGQKVWTAGEAAEDWEKRGQERSGKPS
jgi:hypothetical protein